MTLLTIFWAFLRVGLFSVGGGYAAMPLIQYQVVDAHGWLSLSAFADLVAIAEATPGPIAINAATFVGLRVGGFGGGLIATLGCITPSLIIVTILARVYLRFRDNSALDRVLSCLRPAVVALIASAFLSLLSIAVFGEAAPAFKNVDWFSLALSALAFLAIWKLKWNPVLAMLCCGAVNLLASFIPGFA